MPKTNRVKYNEYLERTTDKDPLTFMGWCSAYYKGFNMTNYNKRVSKFSKADYFEYIGMI
ncbi:MAG: hypothetical protein ACTSQA_03415 [Candidatus Heimdallarchaeaceae archaeon]